MYRITRALDRLLTTPKRRRVAVAVTGAAAVVAGLLLAAVLTPRSGDGPQLAGAALSPTASPSSPAPPIDTTGFGGDLLSPTPSGSPSFSASARASATFSPVPILTAQPVPSAPDAGYGGAAPEPTPQPIAVALDWQRIPDIPSPVGPIRYGKPFQLATGEIGVPGVWEDLSSAGDQAFFRLYDPSTRVWREVAVSGLQDGRAVSATAVGSEGRLFSMVRDINVGSLSMTIVDTSSEPWAAGAEHFVLESGFPDPGDLGSAQAGNYLYIPEHEAGGGTTRFLVYDLASGDIAWSASTAGARYLEVMSDGRYIYAAQDWGGSTDAARYDPASDVWDAVVPDPSFGRPHYRWGAATGVGRLWVPVRSPAGPQQLWTWDGTAQTWSLVETPTGVELEDIRLLGTRDDGLYLLTPSGIYYAADVPE